MSDAIRYTLGPRERGRVWRSSLTGAQFRWVEPTWEVLFDSVAGWHPLRAGQEVGSVYTHAGERFTEVAE